MDPKLFALVTALCFGLNPVTLKLGFQRGGRSDVAVVIGLLVSVPLYILISPFVGGLPTNGLNLPALVGFALGGLFGGGIGRRWMYVAIDRIGASPATAIKNAAPVITTFLGVLLFADDVGPRRWAAVGAIVIGITLVTWKGQHGRSLLDVGVLAAFGSTLSYGIRPVFLKFGLEAANLPLTGALVGAIAALVYALLRTDPKDLRVGLREPSLGLFTVSGVLQGFGFLALTFGLSGGDVSVVYPVTASAPIFTLVFTALLLRGTERVSPGLLAGAVAVVIGVVAL